MDLNKAMIIGRLTRDPELRTIPSGISVANFDIATNRVYTDQSGAKRETVEFHSIVMWRRLAEIASQYLRKGGKVYIEGRLQTRSWDDPNGFKRYKTEIVADNMIMLDRPPTTGLASYPPVSAQAPRSSAPASFARPAPAWASQPPISENQPAEAPADRTAPQDQEEDIPTIDISEDEPMSNQKDEEVSVEDIPF
ncbi:MAG: single-stranded DNA-binding protein [Patescibacteria group bacterium]